MHDLDTRPGTLRESADSQLLLRTIGFSRRQRSDHVLSYSKALKQSHCDSVETVGPQEETVIRRGSSQEAQQGTATSGDVRGAFRGGETEARQAREDVARLRFGRPQGFSSHQRLY